MSKRNNRSPKRILRFEALELRSLMAGDLCYQNIELPEDTDGSGFVSPIDALMVINKLNEVSLNGPSSISDESVMTDVNGDSTISPLDALMIINLLNNNSLNGTDSSQSELPLENRITKIEQSISTGTLGSRFTVDDAVQILSTLRLGGRPEAGDYLQDGKLHHGSDDSGMANQDPLLKRLTRRLKENQIPSETISTITKEIVDSKAAGTPLTLDQVKSRLTELGVDVSKIFPPRPDSAEIPPKSQHTPLTEFLARRLSAEGVSEEVITTITKEIADAKTAGTPLTIAQVKTRLTELGVDVTKIFPGPLKDDSPKDDSPKDDSTDEQHGGTHDPLADSIKRRLTDLGVSEEIITTITKEIADAKTVGTPLTIAQVKTRLTELGVDVTKIFPGPPKGISGPKSPKK